MNKKISYIRLILWNVILLPIAFKMPDFVDIPITLKVNYNPVNIATSIEVNRHKTAVRDVRSNADIIYSYLSMQGLNKYQICGIMGNLFWESGLNPNAIEKENNVGYGIAQWSLDRRVELEQKENYHQLNVQLDFLIEELNDSSKWLNGYQESFYNCTSIEEATRLFCIGWEKPRANTMHLESRIEKAKEYLEVYE